MIPHDLDLLDAVIKRSTWLMLSQAHSDFIERIDGRRDLWLCDAERATLRRIHELVTAPLRHADGTYAKP